MRNRSMWKAKRTKLMYCTVVSPNEYDLDEFIDNIIRTSNKLKVPFLGIDVGKVVGLALAYKEVSDGR